MSSKKKKKKLKQRTDINQPKDKSTKSEVNGVLREQIAANGTAKGDAKNSTKPLDVKDMDETFDKFSEEHPEEPKPEFGFQASSVDGDKEGSGLTDDEEKKILDSEVNAFKESIKVGEQKPNLTIGLDKSDVEGKDSISENVQTEEDEDSVTQGEESDSKSEENKGENGENIPVVEDDQNEAVANDQEESELRKIKKKEEKASVRQLKGKIDFNYTFRFSLSKIKVAPLYNNEDSHA